MHLHEQEWVVIQFHNRAPRTGLYLCSCSPTPRQLTTGARCLGVGPSGRHPRFAEIKGPAPVPQRGPQPVTGPPPRDFAAGSTACFRGVLRRVPPRTRPGTPTLARSRNPFTPGDFFFMRNDNRKHHNSNGGILESNNHRLYKVSTFYRTNRSIKPGIS